MKTQSTKITEYAVSELGTYCLHPTWHDTEAAAQAEIDAHPNPDRYHIVKIEYDDPAPILRARLEAKLKAQRDELEAKLAAME